MINIVKKYPNSRKRRNRIPQSAGAYNLKNRKGKTVYTGMTKNLRQRIKQHHYDKSKHFSHFTVTPTKTKAEANKIENNRLKRKKPRGNRKKR